MDIVSIIKNKINWLMQRIIDYYPTIIQIGITNKCNLLCIMCRRVSVTEKYPSFLEVEKHSSLLEMEMSFERFKEILSQFPKLKKICLTGPGENFLNKDFLKMLKYAKEKKIYVEFFDNFYFLDEEKANKLIDIGVDKIYVSIDGATKETYEKIRIGSDFDRVIKNIKGLFYLKKRRQEIYPEINFNYVINTYNFLEVLAFMDLATSIAVGEKFSIQFIDMVNFNGNQSNLCLKENLTQKIIFQAIKKAKKMGITINHVHKIKKNIINCQHWLMPIIVPHGYVFPCCSAPYDAIDMGNINEKSFKEIWNSDNYKNFRKGIRIGRTPIFCKNCEFYGKK